jgi:hypothetical protein
MTQFSFEWILSLNWLCQEWGQVHNDAEVFRLAWGTETAREIVAQRWTPIR